LITVSPPYGGFPVDLSTAPRGRAGEENFRDFEKIFTDTFSGLMTEEFRETGPAAAPLIDSSVGAKETEADGNLRAEASGGEVSGREDWDGEEERAPLTFTTSALVEPAFVLSAANTDTLVTANTAVFTAAAVDADGPISGFTGDRTGLEADAGPGDDLSLPLGERGSENPAWAAAGAARSVGAGPTGTGTPGGAEGAVEPDSAAETGFAGGVTGETAGEAVAESAGKAARGGERFRGAGSGDENAAGNAGALSPDAVSAVASASVTGAAKTPTAEDPASPAESGAEAEGTEFWGQEFLGPELRSPASESSGDSGRISLRAGEGFVPSLEGGQEKTEKSGEDRRSGRKRSAVELRDYRELSPEQVSSGLSPAGETETEFHPEISRTAPAADLSGPAERGARNEGGSSFGDMLARELRQTINNDIVRHAQVILREGGEGLIRLSLKPESLGNVKIRLELTENKIAGRVIVESGEALRAFERELASLEQAFRDSGYESAELSTFLAQDGSGADREKGEPFPQFAADRAASRYDDSLEKTNPSVSEDFRMGFWPGNRPISINLLV
jgi:hypothetical protein